MFDAQLLIVGTEPVIVYSPLMGRGGDNLTLSLDVVAIEGATIKVDIMTKNSEGTGNGALVAATGLPLTLSTAVQDNVTIGPDKLEELVRYRFTVSGTKGDWVLFRMLNPVWFDSVKA